MNIIELSLTSQHGSFACDNDLFCAYDPTTEEYVFGGIELSTGNGISFYFASQDNPLQENSVV